MAVIINELEVIVEQPPPPGGTTAGGGAQTAAAPAPLEPLDLENIQERQRQMRRRLTSH